MGPVWGRRYSAIKHFRLWRCSRERPRGVMMSLSEKAQRGDSRTHGASGEPPRGPHPVSRRRDCKVRQIGKIVVIMRSERSMSSILCVEGRQVSIQLQGEKGVEIALPTCVHW